MNYENPDITRRSVIGLIGLAATAAALPLHAAPLPTITVSKDPGCGCCSAWVEHLRRSGFTVVATDTRNMQAVKTQLGVPADLGSCHTAQVSGYVIEGHVPAVAIKRLLSEQPVARGLAVPGMPIGSPGMEGGAPEIYEVIQFGGSGQTVFGRFKGDQPV